MSPGEGVSKCAVMNCVKASISIETTLWPPTRNQKLISAPGFFEDLGSKNGTNVNNRRIDGAQRLLSGDVIGIAATTMFYRWLPVEPTRTRESH